MEKEKEKETSTVPQLNKFRQLRKQIDPATQDIWNKEQIFLRNQLLEKDDFKWDQDSLKYVAGVDISFSMDHENIACSALVILDRKSLKIVYEHYEYVELDLPYVPGFLAFREIPSLLPLFEKLREKRPDLWPDVILVDGNGIIHQNGFGLACHLGVLLDTPTIGCGKTFFYVDGLSKDKIADDCHQFLRQEGDFVRLVGKSQRVWAAAVKTSRNASDPVFVSVGHKISLETAINTVVSVSVNRVPEPIRLADIKSRAMIREYNKSFFKLEGEVKKYQMVFKRN